MNRRKNVAAGLLAGLALIGSPAGLADLYLDGGITSESTAVARLELDTFITFEPLPPPLTLRLATGLLLLQGREEQHNAAWLVTPALRWTFGGERGVFVEGGVGAALFLESRLESRELGSAFQFQDRLALGAPLGAGELALSLTHYSNASIKRPNDGFETLTLGYRLAL
ncbi:acyloxyacyl hydrolase [Halomonas sp. MCCC 1A11036]|uniref:Acyloxyacyl hydrolase n=1 Tax=Billgrantia zhangzhouensis TaxID=2733481 RepID=A0ABS9A9U4_9GAMM|nr:acyloxyacyl hydrolase [Halomonas zhangzhouensis]MCE8018706.1 acyloxyacyl hydrolase [Halomonas zhangzhouensis]